MVIGETAEIGDNVTIYQGLPWVVQARGEKGKRHPTIGNNVVISAGAKVLGSFTVGGQFQDWSGFGGLKEVPPDSTVVGVPGKVVARNGRRVEPREDYEN